jgi:hypothetical protein
MGLHGTPPTNVGGGAYATTVNQMLAALDDVVAGVADEALRLPVYPLKVNDADGEPLFQIDARVSDSNGWFEFFRGMWTVGDDLPLLSIAAVEPTGLRTQFALGIQGASTPAEEVTETGPLINIAGDVQGALNVVLQAVPITSGAQFFRMSSAPLGSAPQLIAVGPDTSVSMQIITQNLGHIALMGGYPNEVAVARFFPQPSAVNWFDFSNSADGAALAVAAVGSSTNIGILVQPKGDGRFVVTKRLVVSGDSAGGGTAGEVGFTNVTGTPSNTATPTGWIKVYVGTAVNYLPVYT